MRYYDIHVSYPSSKDGDGYSVFVAVSDDINENTVVDYASKNQLFTEDGDERFVDYVEEITESEYKDAVNA